LSAAIVLARAGLSVPVREAKETVGDGARSLDLTLPGFLHDVCSAVHPMAAASAFLYRRLLAPLVGHWDRLVPEILVVGQFDFDIGAKGLRRYNIQ
jgi:phytoene dehydrogenase-like protein